MKELVLAALAPAEGEGSRGGGPGAPPLPGSGSAPWKAEQSALENGGCPGPSPRLAPSGLSSHLAAACPGTSFFMAKEGPSIPPVSGTQATSGPQAGHGASCPAWLSDGRARFS